MSAIDFLTPIGQALLDAFDPLRRALISPNEMDALLRREGWQPPSRDYFAPLSTALAIGGDVEKIAAALDALNDGDVSIDDVQTALHAAAKLLSDLGAMRRPAGTLPSPLDRTDFWTSFPLDLTQDLLITYLEKAQPVAFAPLHLLGVLDEQTELPKAGDALRVPYQKRRVRWDRLGTMLSDPASLSRDVYGWGAAFDHGKLLLRLETAMRALGVLAGRHVAADPLTRQYFPGDPPAGLRVLRATLLRERRKRGGVEFGLAALPIPPVSGGAPNGLFIGPVVEGAVEGEIALDGPFSIKLAGGLESAGIVGIEMRPGQMKARLDGAAATLAMLLELSGKPSQPWILVGDESSDRVELAEFALGLELDGAATDPELKLRLHTGALRLVIDPSGGDSFLQRIFGSEPQTLQASGDLVWSSKSGLSFDGQAGLQLVVPINATFGPTNVRQLTLGIETKAQAVEITAGVTGHGKLGPVDLAVDNVGLALSLAPVQPPARGVFGDLDLGFGFHPPTGVGLSVDTAAVQGAGFLLHDPAKFLYAGALQLTVRDRFGLEIVGLLTTRMPDGSAGYSLLLLGTLQFPPIPIGFGFSIDKLGVLVGINRTVDVDAMTGALAAGDLDAVLFPRNPAALASVPDGLGKLFPPKQDAHTIGILAGFTWGPSALAQIEIGVIYDTSAPARIIAIGRLTIERPQITLHVLALGVLDFDKGEIDLQARLVGSRILGGDLDGDAAIMARWGDNPDLVLSIGGFHPAYQPPTEFTRRFAPLRRVSFRAHTDESVLRLGLQAYLAVTSSTVQMGARVDFGVTVSAFSVDGMLSFDALIQWDPELYIDVMVRGTVALKIGGATLFGASIAAQLIGPGDWYVTGKATVSVLWWDVHVGFTIGDKPGRPELPAVDGASQLAAALADPRSWGTQATANGLVFVRRASAPGGALVLHPLDELTVRQQIVPLGTRVDRIDAGPLTAPRTFEVAVKVGGRPMATEALSDAFARAKYVVMSDAAKLSAPSFEQMRSGVRVNLDAPAVSAPPVVADWTYQPFVLTAQGLQSPAPRPFAPAATAETRALAGSVAGGGLS